MSKTRNLANSAPQFNALIVPTGTTAQRPSNPNIGLTRFNTDTSALENYTANGWFKVSTQTPIIGSISGTIYSGNTSTLTIDVTNGNLYKFSSNATTTISLSNYQIGKIIEVWMTNNDNNKQIHK